MNGAELQKPVAQSLMELSDCIVRVAFSDRDSCFSTIGPHVRHCLDYYFALKAGVGSGVIDYNFRRRGSAVEHSPAAALSEIADLLLWLRSEKMDDRPVRVLAECSNVTQMIAEFASSFYRELLHVIEHTVHHTAFIVSIAESHGIQLDERAGVAAATLSYRRQMRMN